jgi:hypothetical protein
MLKLISFFFTLSFCASTLFAQTWADPKGELNNQLLSLVRARYDTSLQYIQFTVFDTLLAYSKAENKTDIQDPYHTLRGCILFSTYKDHEESEPDHFIVGIVKNGKIIWDNAPGTSAHLGENILYSQDINHDGEVDLIYSEPDLSLMRENVDGKAPILYYFYILSWNGIRGKFINTSDSTGVSELMGDGGCDLVPSTKNGVKKIETALPDLDIDWGNHKTSTFPRITYTWNGQQYEVWTKSKSKNKSTR